MELDVGDDFLDEGDDRIVRGARNQPRAYIAVNSNVSVKAEVIPAVYTEPVRSVRFVFNTNRPVKQRKEGTSESRFC